MFTITKDFDSLCISHQLHGLDEGHKCARLHGHNVTVRIVLAAPTLDDHGFVVDYGDLADLKVWLWNTYDHRHLNDLVDFQPTAENMARHIYEWCVREKGWPVASIGWSETPATWALYTSPDGVGLLEGEKRRRVEQAIADAYRGRFSEARERSE